MWILKLKVISIARVRIPQFCLSDCNCLSDYAPINFGAPNIKHPGQLSYPRQSQKRHQCD